jgi:excisionase family DNA binding protein
MMKQRDQQGGGAAKEHSTMQEPYVSEKQLAKHLGVTPRTIKRWRAIGHAIPGYRVGRSMRYRLSEVDAWVKAQAGKEAGK